MASLGARIEIEWPRRVAPATIASTPNISKAVSRGRSAVAETSPQRLRLPPREAVEVEDFEVLDRLAATTSLEPL
jgi:hypothetical protein